MRKKAAVFILGAALLLAGCGSDAKVIEGEIKTAGNEEAEETDGDEECDEVVIYHLVGGENDETLEPIEDDEKLDEVFAEFRNQYEDFEDADEAASLEPDADGE